MTGSPLSIDGLLVDLQVLGQDGFLRSIPFGQLDWSEQAGQFYSTLTFTVPDLTLNDGTWIGSLLAEGTPVFVNAGTSGSLTEQFRGTVYGHQRGLDSQAPLSITAHDLLFPMMRSKVDAWYDDGTTGQQVIQDLAQAWKIPLGTVGGPPTVIGPLAFRGKTIADIFTNVLNLAQQKDGQIWVIRAAAGAINVTAPDSDTIPFVFRAGQSILGGSEQVSIESMVTRVKVYRSPSAPAVTWDANNNFTIGTSTQGPASFVDTVDGAFTQFGILQDVVYARRPDNDNDQDAQDAAAIAHARGVLQQKGFPTRGATAIVPLALVPPQNTWPRRGQRVSLQAGTYNGDMLYISGATVDALSKTMTLTLSADKSTLWQDVQQADFSQPDETDTAVAAADVAATGGSASLNSGTAPILQTHDWTCSACSMAWMLTSIGRPTTEAQAVALLGSGINSTVGLVHGDGSDVARVLRNQGLNATNGAVTFDQLAALAGKVPVMIGSAAMNHWVAVAGVSGDTLSLANPAPNYLGVGQSMTRAAFNRWAPFFGAWIMPASSNNGTLEQTGSGAF